MILPFNQRDDCLLRLEHAVARQLADTEDPTLALQAVMGALCATEGWDYGRYWQADPAAGMLRCAATWQAPGRAIAQEMAGPEASVVTLGSGLVGQVWRSAQPLWNGDPTSEELLPGAMAAAAAQRHPTCMFPVAVQDRTLGVMSFGGRRLRHPDQRLLETFRVVGRQVGQFLQRKQREDEIAKLNAELEVRVRQRTTQLEAVNAELEAFSYSIAHDLRAPLTSIDGFSHLLEACSTGEESAPARHYLRRIRAGVRQMSALTEAMLSLARLSRVELEHEEVDLAALARQALAQLIERKPEPELDADTPEHLWVQGDSRLLRQVMTNLLGNAWKFSARKPRTWIGVGSQQRAGETVHFVADRGAGFDMAHAARLFGAFQRLHTPSEFEGTGIGLALVQKIVTGHGGRIWADARPEEGATFYFMLP